MIWKLIGRRPATDLRIMGELFPAAERAARADGVDSFGAEYLLLAALDLEDGSARRAFEHVGVSPDRFRAAIRSQHAEALRALGVHGIDDELLDRHLPDPTSPTGPVKSEPSAHVMFRSVLRRVKKERTQLHSAYFVLAAAEVERGTVIRVIRHLGIDPDALARVARSELDALPRP